MTAAPCRELLLTDEVKDRARALAAAHPADAHLTEMLAKLADGIPTEGMEALIPVVVATPCSTTMRRFATYVSAECLFRSSPR